MNTNLLMKTNQGKKIFIAIKRHLFSLLLVYNINKRVKKRIDILLFKSLEFKNAVGQKVRITEIPVLKKNSPFYFMIQVRLQSFISSVYGDMRARKSYSFKEYLKRVLKWPVYEQLFCSYELKNNA